jgi:hypothetical protein
MGCLVPLHRAFFSVSAGYLPNVSFSYLPAEKSFNYAILCYFIGYPWMSEGIDSLSDAEVAFRRMMLIFH